MKIIGTIILIQALAFIHSFKFIRNTVIIGCFICVKMLKVQDPQWYSHCLTLFDDGITKILKKIWCWRVEHQGFVLCICRIKRTSPKNKFQHENHSYNASSDLDFQYISLVWSKIWKKSLLEILPLGACIYEGLKTAKNGGKISNKL